jgi:UDP-sugar transporter A1/2/3
MKTEGQTTPSESRDDQSPVLEKTEDNSQPDNMVGIHKKYLSLVILIVQSTALVLVMRYSRTVTVDGLKYLPTTAVVLTELLKLTVCVVMVFYNAQWNLSKGSSVLYTEIIQKKTETLKVSVPSVLYTVQNNLLYLALTYLDAATFQVTYQIKILTTAVFSVIILHRTLSIFKWISLVLLTIAVALVQLSNVKEPSASEKEEDGSSLSSAVAGLLAVLCASITSGFAGVYTEKILKGSATSMWIRNIQLGVTLTKCVCVSGREG